jgi:hypothetical protein
MKIVAFIEIYNFKVLTFCTEVILTLNMTDTNVSSPDKMFF